MQHGSSELKKGAERSVALGGMIAVSTLPLGQTEVDMRERSELWKAARHTFNVVASFAI